MTAETITKIQVDPAAFQSYWGSGWTVIPLRRRSKAPLDARWTTKKYVTTKVVERCFREGLNLGVRLSDRQLVLDIDPRNGGVEGFARLCEDLSLNPKEWPRVETGSGGSHYYMTLPNNVQVVDTLPAYPGVEYKSKNRQVVAAGSIHPDTGKRYEWDWAHPDLGDAREAPANLVALITRRKRDSSAPDAGEYDNQQIAAMLGGLEPTDFQAESEWRKLMMAVHYSSNGNAREEFINWSTSDPNYADQAEVIGRRWDSLRTDSSDQRVTGGTLRKYLSDADQGHLIPSGAVGTDFDDNDVHDAELNADQDAWMEGPQAAEPMLWDETKLTEMLDRAEEAMLAADVPLFKMGPRLIHPVRQDKDSSDDEGIRRKAGALIVRELVPLRLREYVTQHVPFYVVTKGGKRKKAVPLSFSNHILVREDRWIAPTLIGIVETPTLRRDGTLLQDDGYDEKSCLLMDKGGLQYPKIKEHPTREHALRSLAVLKEPFKDFPFVQNAKGGSASRSVLLSAVLTGLVRRTLRSAPIHGVSAPTPGTGKSLAINVVSMIVSGRMATSMSQGSSEEENEKRLFSSLLLGDQLLLIDNITRPVEGAALCTILTEPNWTNRILGESRNVTVMTNTLLMANGNNLTFKGDMTRRALLARMDAEVEQPEKRRFNVDLETEVPRRRPELVVAALTILRAFVVAGRPGLDKLEAFGSFVEWSNLIRGALVWLGESDPCTTRAFITHDDPDRNDFEQLLLAIRDNMEEDSWWTPGELIKAGEDIECSDDCLSEAIRDIVPKGGKKLLGEYLSSRQGKIVGGMRLQKTYNTHRKLWTYRVELCEGAGKAGNAGMIPAIRE